MHDLGASIMASLARSEQVPAADTRARSPAAVEPARGSTFPDGVLSFIHPSSAFHDHSRALSARVSEAV